jgi:exodeoxyribonuclease VII small subunit
MSDFQRWRNAVEHGSFEETFAALEAVVDHLDRGHLPLEESIECYELGTLLADRCNHLLRTAELRIRRIETADAPDEVPDIDAGDLFDENDSD